MHDRQTGGGQDGQVRKVATLLAINLKLFLPREGLLREVAGSTALFLVPSNICGKVDAEVMDAAGPQLKYFIFF